MKEYLDWLLRCLDKELATEKILAQQRDSMARTLATFRLTPSAVDTTALHDKGLPLPAVIRGLTGARPSAPRKGDNMSTMPTPISILAQAENIVNGERQEQYGSPVESMNSIAALWTGYLRHPINGKDVAMMMALLKIAREQHNAKRDNLVDAAGYISIAERCENCS